MRNQAGVTLEHRWLGSAADMHLQGKREKLVGQACDILTREASDRFGWQEFLIAEVAHPAAKVASHDRVETYDQMTDADDIRCEDRGDLSRGGISRLSRSRVSDFIVADPLAL
jgi:hypothetical protein